MYCTYVRTVRRRTAVYYYYHDCYYDCHSLLLQVTTLTVTADIVIACFRRLLLFLSPNRITHTAMIHHTNRGAFRGQLEVRTAEPSRLLHTKGAGEGV